MNARSFQIVASPKFDEKWKVHYEISDWISYFSGDFDQIDLIRPKSYNYMYFVAPLNCILSLSSSHHIFAPSPQFSAPNFQIRFLYAYALTFFWPCLLATLSSSVVGQNPPTPPITWGWGFLDALASPEFKLSER